MKSALILLFVAVLLLGISSCTQTFYENAAKDKVAVVGRNLVLLASDAPAELRVSYYETSDGTSNNLVTKTIHTPYILDMGKAVVVYDSVDYKWRGGYCGKKHLIDGYKEINVSAILGDGGAEYLKLENRSEQVVKFAVVGVQKLVTKRDDERNVIESQPSPIYKGVPLLYLLKPELAPNGEFYYRTLDYGDDASQKNEFERIALYSDRLGDFPSADLPFSATKIVSLFENESQHLYVTYSNYSLGLQGQVNANREFRATQERGLELFARIQPQQVFQNRGTLPLLPLGFEGQLRRSGETFLVKENW